MRYQCTTCGGEYDEFCQDGLQYYHACAPSTDDKGIITERKDKRDENVKTKKDGLGREKIN